MSIFNNQSGKYKYGITEAKKAELDRLANQVLRAQHDVEELQAVVNSLTAKSADFSAMLTQATANRAGALNNNTMVNQLVQSAYSLYNNSNTAYAGLKDSEDRLNKLAAKVSKLINELIFSAEVINKLANEVVRQKALNPLISDELITLVTTAGTDANSAVALTLVALKSVFAAETSCIESEANANLVVLNSGKFYEVLSGKVIESLQPVPEEVQKLEPLQKLISDAFEAADTDYNKALQFNNEITKELNNATAALNVAQANLSSLQAGLAAANAAAFAA
jgi:predicted  nucleic acid-binding Zn-ribbon protein